MFNPDSPSKIRGCGNAGEIFCAGNGLGCREVCRSLQVPRVVTVARRIVHEEQFNFGVACAKCQCRFGLGEHVAGWLLRVRPYCGGAIESCPPNLLGCIAVGEHCVTIGQGQQDGVRRRRIGDVCRGAPRRALPRNPPQLIGRRRIVRKHGQDITRLTGECDNGRNFGNRRPITERLEPNSRSVHAVGVDEKAVEGRECHELAGCGSSNGWGVGSALRAIGH